MTLKGFLNWVSLSFLFPAYRTERIVLLGFAVVLPLPLLWEHIAYTNHFQYPYVRICISIASGLIIIASFMSKLVRNTLQVLVIILIYGVVSHFVFLTYVNNFDFYFACLLTSLVILCCFYFNSWQQLILFQVSMLVLLLQASLLSNNIVVNIWVFLIFYLVMNFLVFFVQLYIFNKNKKLQNITVELEKSALKLERTNKSLEQFAYIVSHDLQEPLRTVNSYLQLVNRRYSDKVGKEGEEFISIATDGLKRMHNLIQSLLKYSRTSTEKMVKQQINLNKLLKSVLQNLDTLIKETGCVMQVAELPIVTGDEVQLIQLFQNMIGNAIKYRSTIPPIVSITCKDQNGAHLFSIADNGIGIAERYQETVFKIFNGIHQEGGADGSGIGLAICKKIILNHDGDIWLTSELGKGSIFFFTLPMA